MGFFDGPGGAFATGALRGASSFFGEDEREAEEKQNQFNKARDTAAGISIENSRAREVTQRKARALQVEFELPLANIIQALDRFGDNEVKAAQLLRRTTLKQVPEQVLGSATRAVRPSASDELSRILIGPSVRKDITAQGGEALGALRNIEKGLASSPFLPTSPEPVTVAPDISGPVNNLLGQISAGNVPDAEAARKRLEAALVGEGRPKELANTIDFKGLFPNPEDIKRGNISVLGVLQELAVSRGVPSRNALGMAEAALNSSNPATTLSTLATAFLSGKSITPGQKDAAGKAQIARIFGTEGRFGPNGEFIFTAIGDLRIRRQVEEAINLFESATILAKQQGAGSPLFNIPTSAIGSAASRIVLSKSARELIVPFENDLITEVDKINAAVTETKITGKKGNELINGLVDELNEIYRTGKLPTTKEKTIKLPTTTTEVEETVQVGRGKKTRKRTVDVPQNLTIRTYDFSKPTGTVSAQDLSFYDALIKTMREEGIENINDPRLVLGIAQGF